MRHETGKLTAAKELSMEHAIAPLLAQDVRDRLPS